MKNNILITFVRAVFFSVVLLCCSFTAMETHADESMKSAISAWLDDDDQVAIPLLSRLAGDGNEMAMILLGQIARRPGELSPFLRNLSYKERLKLLKAEKGKFRESWLKRVNTNKKLADALLGIDDQENRFTNILLLLELGEVGQALRSYQRLLSFGLPAHFNNSLEYLDIPKRMASLKWYGLTYQNRTHDVIINAVSDMAESTLDTYEYLSLIHKILNKKSRDQINLELIRTVLNGDRYPQKGESWDYVNKLSDSAFEIYRTLPEIHPIRDVCSELCPGEVDSCLRTSYSLLRGYRGFLDMQSPAETIIPSKKYFSSKRFTADLIRRLDAGLLNYWIEWRPSVINQCIGKKVFYASPVEQRLFDRENRQFLGVQLK